MKFSDEFRDRELVLQIAGRIASLVDRPAAIMEVCGTHTMSVSRFGLKSLLPRHVELISGPGCPVCVTSQWDIDAFIALGDAPETVLVSFGDMLRVPGSAGSLERKRALGADVRVVYSAFDAVEIAAREPDKDVVFFGVGFETTMPSTAMAIASASEQGLSNFSIFCAHKTIPAALRALLAGDKGRISGLLCPGHVTTIIGASAYEFVAAEFGIPCAVAGFEPVDIMLGVEAILNQIKDGISRVDNCYSRAVPDEPNARAKEILERVFEACDAEWRGLGSIPGSGVRIRAGYARFDARVRFASSLRQVPQPPSSNCRCGDVLRGELRPADCPLFGAECSPEDPLGPCMVSSEGACAAAHRYGGA